MNEKLAGYLGSFLLHVLLLAALFLMVYTPVIDFIKIEIVEFGYNAEPNNESFISPATSNPASSGIPDKGSKSNLIPDRVNLPEALSDSNEPLYFPDKVETAYNNVVLDQNTGSRSLREQIKDEIIAGEDIAIDDKPVLGSSRDYINSLTEKISIGETGDSPYILEGEITTRTIIKQIIPEYPEDFQQNSRVKIRFEVGSDGAVSNMLIVEKSDPALEEISLNALQQWKFNSLTTDITQIGFITFVFQLK
jgi:outer membrane biosynthesis protein TonB